MKKILLFFSLILFAGSIMAQKHTPSEKQAKANEMIALLKQSIEKAKEGTLTEFEFEDINEAFYDNDKYLGNWVTGQENQVILNNFYRMKCYTRFIALLTEMRYFSDIEDVAKEEFNLPDDNRIVDVATWKLSHQYDYSNRVNDEYDVIKGNGFELDRADYLVIAGDFYSHLILGTRLAKTNNYQLMDSLFVKGIKYGYFDEIPNVLKYQTSISILIPYTEQSEISTKYLDAASLFMQSRNEITQKQLSDKDAEYMNKANEIFARSIKQNINTTEDFKGFVKGFGFYLKSNTLTDNEKADFIKNNLDAWIAHSRLGREWKGTDKEWSELHINRYIDGYRHDSILFDYTSASVIQILLNSQDKTFTDKFAGFASQYCGYYKKAYQFYLYYKSSGQKQLGKTLYKKFFSDGDYSKSYPK